MKSPLAAITLLFLFLPKAGAEGPGRNYVITNIVEGDTLNVRSGPGMNFPVVAKLVNGTSGVSITGDQVLNGSDDWLPISFPGGKGWTRPKYLATAANNTAARPTPSTPSTAVDSPNRINLPGKPPELVFVEGGPFTMGGKDEESSYKCKDENCTKEHHFSMPQHSVTVDNFQIGKYEVTREQYAQMVVDLVGKLDEKSIIGIYDLYSRELYFSGDKNKEIHELIFKELPTAHAFALVEFYETFRRESLFRSESSKAQAIDDYLTHVKANATRPAQAVSHLGAQYYCQWLTEKHGGKWRLPTEAEWEFAARGGNKSKGYIYSGSDNLDEVAWHTGNTDIGGARPVGGKLPNELGIYDMSGNVSEYCEDWMDWYTAAAATNPKGPEKGAIKVARGGNFYHLKNECKSFFRTSSDDGGYHFRGFRVAKDN
jgi:formylglycine-generating enzyme required for sulfatase activity